MFLITPFKSANLICGPGKLVKQLGLVMLMVVACFCSAGCDKVHLTNGGTGENGVLVDATSSGSFQNDLRFTGAAGTDIAVGDCSGPGEVIAYTNEHPPTLKASVAWTTSTDIANVNFENQYQIPVFVWIVKGPFAAAQARALNATAVTGQIWSDERQGISFSSVTIVDATSNPNAPNFYGFTCPNKAAAIKTQIGFDPTGLNIYYVDMVGGSTTRGVSCTGSGVIAMGSNTSGALLAHEIGHAFSLDHVNTFAAIAPYFDATNVMHNASNNRRYLTEGQTFRSVVSPRSAINTAYNARPGLITRNCPHSASTTDPLCPAVQKRIWADGINWPPN